MVALSFCRKRFTFSYMYIDDSVLYFSPFHYDTYQDAFNALGEFLRLCALDGDDVVFSCVIPFSIKVVRHSV